MSYEAVCKTLLDFQEWVLNITIFCHVEKVFMVQRNGDSIVVAPAGDPVLQVVFARGYEELAEPLKGSEWRRRRR